MTEQPLWGLSPDGVRRLR